MTPKSESTKKNSTKPQKNTNPALELETHIKTNQSNNNIDPLTKIDTQVREKLYQPQNNTNPATRIENL